MTLSFHNGTAIGVLIGTNVHILRQGGSSYSLYVEGKRHQQYCCQDRCCDEGLKPDVREIVRQAKEEGAKQVVIRTGQNQFHVAQIEGLPVSDVSNHVGYPETGFEIARRWT